MVYAAGEKPGKESEEVKLLNASKQIVETAILQAVHQVSQEDEKEQNKPSSRAERQQPDGKSNTPIHKK
ncbi:A-kinase anchor protein inhibitor 1-like [Xenopus laevis]|uniref:A-kinase anchor protein inhibitor 1-like n=1 Tax=Xenopus laevis TaxID=8355 RepID=A0A8J1L5J1_XENLA|nr:A-kinase anchor protein inhibitor 1-like [Xenopus laevis]